MKKLAIIAAISALSSESYTATFELGFAGLDRPNDPFEPGVFTELSYYSSTSFVFSELNNSPVAIFSVSLGSTVGFPDDFTYTADWTYYAASGFLVAQNVVCNSLGDGDFCNSYQIGGLQNEEGFTPVTALDTATQTPLSGPASDAFDLRWTATTSSGEYDWKLTFAPTAVPVPAAAWLFGSALVGLVSLKRNQ